MPAENNGAAAERPNCDELQYLDFIKHIIEKGNLK